MIPISKICISDEKEYKAKVLMISRHSKFSQHDCNLLNEDVKFFNGINGLFLTLMDIFWHSKKAQ